MAVGTRLLSENIGKTELVFKMQLAENANAAGCIRLSSQLHGQTDGLRIFCANSYVIAYYKVPFAKVQENANRPF